MTTNNPYAAGWMHAENNNSAISVFGALPYPTTPPPAPPGLISFHLTAFNPTMLNCMVYAPHSRPFLRIVTDTTTPGYTTWTDINSQNIAVVEWQAHPSVEIRDLVPKQSVRNWLRLSHDKRSRSMNVRNGRYIWAPEGAFVCLYNANAPSSDLLARVSRGQGIVSLDMTPQAMQLGLLEACLVASVLLQSGRSID